MSGYTAPPVPGISYAIATNTDPAWHRMLQSSGTGAYPTADLAIYAPIRIPAAVVVRSLFVINGGVVSGNINVGLYSASGTRVLDGGQVAHAEPVASQVFNVTDTLVAPGLYYMAVTLDNTTGRIYTAGFGAPVAAAAGWLTEQLGTGAALPATATWTVPQTLAYQPAMGVFVSDLVT